MRLSISLAIITAGILIAAAILLSAYFFAPKYSLVHVKGRGLVRINIRSGASSACLVKMIDNKYVLSCNQREVQ